LQFELLVLFPIVCVVAAAGAYHVTTRSRAPMVEREASQAALRYH